MVWVCACVCFRALRIRCACLLLARARSFSSVTLFSLSLFYADLTGPRSSIKAAQQSKADRLHAAKQAREAARDALVHSKRYASSAPSIVQMLPLDDDVDWKSLWVALVKVAETSPAAGEGAALPAPGSFAPITLRRREAGRARGPAVTLLPPPETLSDPLVIADVARVADALLAVGQPPTDVPRTGPGARRAVSESAVGGQTLAALRVLRAMGCPACAAVSLSSDGSLKERSAAKKAVTEGLGLAGVAAARVVAVDGQGLREAVQEWERQGEDGADEGMELADAKGALDAASPTPSSVSFAACRDADAALRALGESLAAPPRWRQTRCALVPETAQLAVDQQALQEALVAEAARAENGASAPAAPSRPLALLRLSAYVRCAGLDARSAVHVPGVGDLLVRRVRVREALGEPVDREVIPAAASRAPLEREHAPDATAGEQTWPTEEELADAKAENRALSNRRKLPEGTSEYQAAWILDADDDELAEEDDDADEAGADGKPAAAASSAMDDDAPELVPVAPTAAALERHLAGAAKASEGVRMDGAASEAGGWAPGGAAAASEFGDFGDAATAFDEDLDGDDGDGASGSRARLRDLTGEELSRRFEDERDFPDEMETPREMPARERFGRYRGLKSFRSSPWDARESLPREYARVFAFEDFARARARALAAAKAAGAPGDAHGAGNGAPVGSYVDVDLEVVLPKPIVQEEGANDAAGSAAECSATHRAVAPAPTASTLLAAAEAFASRVSRAWRGECPPPVATALLQHETRLSVVHLAVRKEPSFERPIPAKRPALVVCGPRTLLCAPVFSDDDPRADKHKSLKFLPDGDDAIVSIYAPIAYGPMPVLFFSIPDQDGDEEEEKEGDMAAATDVATDDAVPANPSAASSFSTAVATSPEDHVCAPLPLYCVSHPWRLAGTGSLRSSDPDRVSLKRIVLSGHPTRVHRANAVVKHLFFNPDDVRWFRPLELWTKSGRRGRIREPVGTHGLLKAVFDGNVSQQDAVCLTLYKRTYPVWPPLDGTFQG